MKKDPPTNDKKILRFLLEQQLPDARVAGLGRDGKPLTVDDAIAVTAVDHVTQVALETCRCTHLQEHLPHLLDLELCKAVHHPRGWVVANPVHSMHLQTQLEDAVPAMAHNRQPPVLYGEEQQRTMALNTEGIVEYWCPLDGYSAVIHDDTAMEKMEHMPTLQNIHKTTVTNNCKHPSLLPVPSSTAITTPNATALSFASVFPSRIPTVGTITVQSDLPVSSLPSASAVLDSLDLPEPVISVHPEQVDKPPDGQQITTKVNQLSSPTMDVGATDGIDKRPEDANDVVMKDLEPKVPQDIDLSDSTKSENEERKGKSSHEESIKGEDATGKNISLDPSIRNASEQVDTFKQTSESKDTTEIQLNVTTSSQEFNHHVTEDAIPMPIESSILGSSSTLDPVPVASDETPLVTKPENERVISYTSTVSEVDDSLLVFPEEKFNHLRIEEDRIRLIRRSLSSHRIMPKKKVDPKKKAEPTNKRKREDFYKTPGIPGWHPSNLKDLTQEQEKQWLKAQAASRNKVDRWIENFRICRQTFWDERERQYSSPLPTNDGCFYLPSDHQATLRCCQTCATCPEVDKYWDGSSKKARKPRRKFCGDDIMQCLECNYVGCSPQSIARDSKQHILQHLLISGHKFAVSCGERGQLFCFCCGDFVYHDVFEQEKARIDYGKNVPLMAWKPHQLYRSFDPFHFMQTQDHGIVWRGLVATYPQLVPQEHLRATEATNRRQAMFNGDVEKKWLANKPVALTFAASQSLLTDDAKHKIQTPVGMYNLGNTCYKSAVLQCLVHCLPLQRFFMKQNGHHHHACKLYRQREANKRKKKKAVVKPEDAICLACEMDKLYLSYYGSTIGVDVRGAIEEACNHESPDIDVNDTPEKGDPLIISEMLTSSWKSGGMSSLASYKQHDSHEFMISFLEMVGKQTKQHWSRVLSAIHVVKNDNAIVEETTENQHDIVKALFEGSLSSVLLCEECGNKRKRTEEFLNVSLSLSEQVSRIQSTTGPTKPELSVEKCLERFVTSEKLGDGVDCPSCGKKTSTQKQHTFGTLPKVLCLHLKRFDAAQNKKIDDFVSFPARGLNMGKYLAQWCEVTRLPLSSSGVNAEPQICYDLFGTVNHVGNMQSGHYVANAKVNDRWYHFNDAHVSLVGGNGNEDAVVNNAGAYILFYVRREERRCQL